MSFKCIHISDVHFRGLQRHEEYKKIFINLFEKSKELKPDLIFIGGDIVHSKTQGISPELIDVLTWWFNSLADIAPTHVILGNHDGLILNENRQDAITPIINAIDNKNISLYKKSGVYPTGIKSFNWCVFSCFDEENWKNVKPIEGDINIACFHGGVLGSKTDTDWDIEGEVSLSFFNDYDFGFLGDIHKYQYLDEEKRIAYPGSTVQQNYGEDILKGFLFWDIKSKNEYKSKIYYIDNPHPYVTVDWSGSVDQTILFLDKVKKGCRFRIRSSKHISQAEIKLIHHYLKNKKEAKEIVYQTLEDKKSDIIIDLSKKESLDIRSQSERKNLIKEYYDEIDDETLNKIDNIFIKNLDRIPKDFKDSFGQNWSINSLKFDNTFSYGKNNFINFDNLNGVVGLFGNNRIGKSSIPGTLMYTLFNTTDRGTVKNANIVNMRKGSCNAEVTFTIGTDQYLVSRETIKKTSKKNITTASTNLSLSLLSNENTNENEEQRRETEKILRNLIGTPEDFLYTSFASQGEMNTFIKEKTSARKAVLSKFLNIEIYEELHKKSREDFTVLKNRLSNSTQKNWDELKKENLENIKLNKEKINSINEENSNLRNDIVSLNVELENIKSNTNKHPSGHTKNSANKELVYLENSFNNLIIEKQNIDKKIEECTSKLNKIESFKKDFSLEDLKIEKEKLKAIESKLSNVKASYTIAKNKQKEANNELKILDQVPCEDNFPDCKFIKKAHKSKKEISILDNTVKELSGDILEIKNAISKIQEENIESKIKKYNEVLNKEYKAKLDKENFSEKYKLKSLQEKDLNKKLENIKLVINEIQSLNADEFLQKEIEVTNKIEEIQNSINNNELKVLSLNKEIFSFENSIEKFKSEKEEYYKLIDEFKIYDLFSSCVNKKGIPTMLINSYLPKINNEINKILSGVTNFEVYLEEEKKGNNLNVYIDYGDSKRVIECASGMEKMMSSIAIRVALINISSLSKSDVFIIDEGFGSLDSTNIEACSRLLNSLKKYFKSIIIISHVDEIKDIVDKNIEITLKGKDSHVRYE
jgi:DNA repair exonuclease SbcCD ATPase subunit